MTDLITSLIQSAQEQTQRAQTAARELAAQESNQIIAQRIVQLRLDLAEVIGEDLIAALNMDFDVFELKHDGTGSEGATFTDSENGKAFRIVRYFNARSTMQRADWSFRIKVDGSGILHIMEKEYRFENQVGFLLILGQYRAAFVKVQQEREQQAEKDRQHDEDRKLADQRRAERIKAADVVHQQCLAQVEAARTDALNRLWRWKEGAVLTLYKVRWCSGAINSCEDDTSFDYDAGWSLTDHLDDQSYITLLPVRSYGFLSGCFKLSMADHKPTFERIDIGSLDQLDGSLKQDTLLIHIPGIEWFRTYLDDAPRLRPAEAEGASLREFLDYHEPLDWVKTLVDAL